MHGFKVAVTKTSSEKEPLRKRLKTIRRSGDSHHLQNKIYQDYLKQKNNHKRMYTKTFPNHTIIKVPT